MMPPNTLAQAATARIQVLAPTAELDFFDTRSADLPRPVTPLEAWRLMHARPLPGLRQAFWLRDTVSAWFGVRRIGGLTGRFPEHVRSGDMLDFFRVEAISDRILTLTARDRHLDVMTCLSVHDSMLTVTSSVKTHNLFGRAYMLPVRPAHKLIVTLYLKRLQQALQQESQPRP